MLPLRFRRPLRRHQSQLQTTQLLLCLLHRFRLGGGVQPELGCRFVHQVNGLVRQAAVVDVAVPQADGGLQGLIRDGDAVVALIALPKALQNGQAVPG